MYISYIVCILSIYEWKGKKPLSVCWDDWEGPSSHKHIVHIPASTSLLFVQSLSHVCLFAVPWTIACQASLSLTISWSLPKFMAMESVMLSSHLILCHPLLLPPSIFPSIRDFTNESVLHIRWPKYWSFSFSISPFNEYSGLISFRMDWLDLRAAQVSLKSLL